MIEPLKLFIPSPSSRFYPQVVEYLNNSGINIAILDRELFFRVKGIEIYFARGFDIPNIIKLGWGDIGITGLDAIEETPSKNITLIKKLGIRYSNIVLVSNKLNSKDDLNPGDLVVTEYQKIANQYFVREKISGLKMVHVSGAAEVYGYIPNVSAIITLATSGKTLIDNDLKTLDVIFRTQACLIGNKSSVIQKNEQIRLFIDQLKEN